MRLKFTSKTKQFTCAALSTPRISSGRLLASGSQKGFICVWEIDTVIEHLDTAPTPSPRPFEIDKRESGNENQNAPMATPLHEKEIDSYINSLTFSPSGSRLASSSPDIITIVETSTLEHLHTLQTLGLSSKAIIFDPLCDQYLLSSGIDKGIHCWHVNDKRGEASPSKGLVRQYSIDELALHPDGKILAALRSDYTVFLWDLQSGTLDFPKIDFDHRADVRSLTFSPNKGDKLLSTSDDNTAQVCDVATGKRLYVFRGHKDWVRSGAWSPDGNYIATASDDGSIRFWEVGNHAEPDAIAVLNDIHGGTYVTAVAFSPNGKYLISGGCDNNLIIWEKATEKNWQPKHEPSAGHTGRVASILVTPDSKYVLSASADQTLRGWDIESGKEISQTKIDWVDFKMWWDLSGVPQGGTPNHVVTPQGAWLHHLPGVLDNQTISQWRVWFNNDTNQWWITFNNKDTIFIPKDYCPRSSLVIGSKVIIGSVLELIYVLEFKTPVIC